MAWAGPIPSDFVKYWLYQETETMHTGKIRSNQKRYPTKISLKMSIIYTELSRVNILANSDPQVEGISKYPKTRKK